MKYQTFKGENYSGGAVTKPGSRIFYCVLTTDLHTTHSASQEVQEYVYADALLSGAGKYTREQFVDAVNILGASLSVHVVDSKLTITIKSTHKNATKVLELFSVMMQKPTFSAKEIIRIKKQITNELNEYKEDARGRALDNFVNELYTPEDRRYTSSPDTLIDKLSEVSRSTLTKLHETARSSIWTVTTGGTPKVTQILQPILGTSFKKSKSTDTQRTHTPREAHSSMTLLNVPSKQNIEFSIGGALPLTLHDKDYLPFVFGLSVLGKWGGFTGRLMSTVREKEGLTYTIYGKTETVGGTEAGYWRIMTFFAPTQAVQGLQSTIREITKIHTHGISKEELRRFNIILKTQQTLLADSVIQSTNELHGYLVAGFTLDEISLYKAKLLTLTQKELNQARRTYLNPDKLIISGAGPITTVSKELERLN